MAREQLLAETFIGLADTLVDEYDVVDFMQTLAERSLELLAVDAAGIMLADSEGRLRHASCSSEQMRVVEFFELQVEEGPCFDAFRTGQAIQSASPADAQTRWPRFAPRAKSSGYLAVSAVPMRLRSQIIGAFNLFSEEPRVLSDDDLAMAQALADIATIGILHQRVLRDARTLTDQLESALESRIAIEQAKGVLAAHLQLDVDRAFELIRRYARARNRLLSDTARQIVNGTVLPTEISQEPSRVL